MNLKNLAKIVDDAALNAKPISQLSLNNQFSEKEAYEIQANSIARRYNRGEKLVGVKLGFTSKAKMEQMGVHDMIWGRLTDGMLIGQNSSLLLEKMIHPRAEPEICFLVKKEISKEIPLSEIKEYIYGVAGAIEVIDSRYENFKFSYASLSIGNSGQSIVVLSSIDDGLYEWVSEDGVLIYTYGGKIIKTVGLQYDSSFKAANPEWIDGYKSNIQLDLYNPDALSLMGKQSISFQGSTFINHVEQTIEVSQFMERISIDSINWRAVNQYAINQEGQVIKSIQKIHPYLPKIEIQYFFK